MQPLRLGAKPLDGNFSCCQRVLQKAACACVKRGGERSAGKLPQLLAPTVEVP